MAATKRMTMLMMPVIENSTLTPIIVPSKSKSSSNLMKLSPSELNKGAMVINKGDGKKPQLEVLPAIEPSAGSAQAELPPTGGDSIPFVEAVDLANPWIGISQETLGIYV